MPLNVITYYVIYLKNGNDKMIPCTNYNVHNNIGSSCDVAIDCIYFSLSSYTFLL